MSSPHRGWHQDQHVERIGELRLATEHAPSWPLLRVRVWQDDEGTTHGNVREHESESPACCPEQTAGVPRWTPRAHEKITCERCVELVEATVLDHCARFE